MGWGEGGREPGARDHICQHMIYASSIATLLVRPQAHFLETDREWGSLGGHSSSGKQKGRLKTLKLNTVPALSQEGTQLESWGGVRPPGPPNKSAWRPPKWPGTWYLVPGTMYVPKYCSNTSKHLLHITKTSKHMSRNSRNVIFSESKKPTPRTFQRVWGGIEGALVLVTFL